MNTTENNKKLAEFLNKGYSVNEEGEVYNSRGQKMKTTITKNGYERFNTSRPTKSYLVHRLVAVCFIENPLNKEQVNHKDGNKLNNKVSNLEWVTSSENMIHGFENNLISKNKNNRGVKHFRSIPIIAKDENGNTIHIFESAGEAERLKGFDRTAIRDAVKGKLKTYRGLYWYDKEQIIGGKE